MTKTLMIRGWPTPHTPLRRIFENTQDDLGVILLKRVHRVIPFDFCKRLDDRLYLNPIIVGLPRSTLRWFFGGL